MNRRTFLFAMGATACGAKAKRAPVRRPRRPSSASDRAVQGGEYGMLPTILTGYQVRRSAIALHGDVLAQVAGTELRTYDARTLRHIETRDLAPSHFCFARDGALVVYSHPGGGIDSTLYRIGPSRNLETFTGPLLLPDPREILLPGITASQVFLVHKERILTLAIVNGHVEEGPELTRPSPTRDNRDQLVMRDDGSIVAPDGEPGLRVIAPDGNGPSYSMKGRSPRHIVGASGERIWYSYAPGMNGLTQLFLAKIATPLAEEHVFDVSPLRMTHVASGGGAAAVIAVQLLGPTEVRMELIVIGEDGKERWRVALPDDLRRRFGPKSGHLVIDEHRVIFSKFDSTLFGWDAASGKPIG